MATKGIPYGVTNFGLMQRENLYYVDKTAFIPVLEKADKFVTFLRPRRFGKTLLLAVLDAYYNVKYKDKFDDYFKDQAVYKNLTDNRSSYVVMKFDFSKVDNRIDYCQQSFNTEILMTLDKFLLEYSNYFPAEIYKEFRKIKDADNPQSNDGFKYVLDKAYLLGLRLYIIIDEYDNFANSLLARNEQDYISLTHGDGFFRLFFNVLKAYTSGMNSPVERIFITGVSPLTLSDVTSGYNIGKNHSLDNTLNQMVGFTEIEVVQMLDYYRQECGTFQHTNEEIMELIKPWYNNYCFNRKCLGQDRVFNSDMLWYFLGEYTKDGEFPDAMVDTNIKTDYDKMRMLVRYDKDFGRKASIIQGIINNGEIKSVINPEFSISQLQDDKNLVSLLFYLGMLSIDRFEEGVTVLKIPNLTVKSQFYTYMSDCYKDCLKWRSDDSLVEELGRMMAYRGQALEFIDYVVSCMTELSGPRDFDPQAEAFVKGFILATMGVRMNFYTVETEVSMGNGYSDIYIRPMKDAKHSFVVELKYLKANATDAEVKAKEDEAETQLRQYLSDKVDNVRNAERGISCRGIILVMSGCKKRVLRYLE